MQFDMLNGRPCRSGSKFLSDVTQAGTGQASRCFGGQGGRGLWDSRRHPESRAASTHDSASVRRKRPLLGRGALTA